MKPTLHLPVLVFLLSLGCLAYAVEQHAFTQLIILYTLSFAAYSYILVKRPNYFFPFLLGLAFVTRIMLIPAFPQLSDDIYRFYWDAWVYEQGVSPYAMRPTEVFSSIPSLEMEGIYDELNSPEYYSVYPPMLQWIFRCAYWLSPSIEGFAVAYKSFILIAEALSIGFLYLCIKKLRINNSSLFIYALNPLVIIELSGNAHPEAFMITGLIMLIYGLIKIPSIAPFGWALGIGVKLQPLLLAPLLIIHSFIKKKALWLAGSFLLVVLLLLPLFLNMTYLQNFTESLRLYTQTFEFNGSLYKVFRWIGFQWTGYNMIKLVGPVLTVLAFVSIILLSIYYYSRKKALPVSLLKMMLVSWMIYLLCSPIVHPWYITPLILFSVFTGFRSMILWSYLIIFTYLAYSYQPVREPVWLAYIEYIPVLILLIFDLRKQTPAQ